MKVSLHPAQASANALLLPRRSRDTCLPAGQCPTAQGRGQHADQPCGQSCTLLLEGHFLARAASARLAWGGSTSKVVATRRHFCFASWNGLLTVHVRRHQREVCPVSRGVMSPEGSTPIRRQSRNVGGSQRP